MPRLGAAVGALAALALLGASATSARPSYCPPIHDAHAQVVSLSATLGCGAVGHVALATVESSLGYYKSKHWYCRWGQGGTRPVRYHGHVYYAGFCASVPSFRTVSFLGRRRS